MKVPFADLSAQYQSIKGEIDKAINSVIDESAYIGGHFVSDFERQFAKEVGVKHCIGVANGTDAISTVMKMSGIGAGDEVITTASSWIASSEAISLIGAKPVFVDIDPDYYTMDPARIIDKITPQTKAIFPVHLYGQMADLEGIKRICDEHDLLLFEDCAQAHLSQFSGKCAGTFGSAGTFSFYPGKNLGAYGDAGCIVTNDDELASKCRMYSNHGQASKHDHRFEGVNSRLDGLQASILSAKLPYLREWNQQRIDIAMQYSELLKDTPDVVIPRVRQGSLHTFHLYVIRVKNREALARFLKDDGIQTAVHYPTALTHLPVYRSLVQDQKFPNAEKHQSECLSLPMYPGMKREMVDCVVDKVIEFYSNGNSRI